MCSLQCHVAVEIVAAGVAVGEDGQSNHELPCMLFEPAGNADNGRHSKQSYNARSTENNRSDYSGVVVRRWANNSHTVMKQPIAFMDCVAFRAYCRTSPKTAR